MSDQPLINGQVFDFSNVKIDIPGLGNVPVQEINYSDEMDYGVLRSSGSAAVEAQTGGVYSASAGLTVEKKVHTAILKALAAASPDGQINLYEFPISVVYAKAGEATIADTLLACKYGGGESSGSGGSSDALVVPVTLSLKYILWDGVGILGANGPA